MSVEKTKTWQWAVVATLLVVVASPLVAQGGGETSDVAVDIPEGQAAFVANKCNLCHSVEVAGIEAKTKSEKLRGPDQSQVGERYELEWLVQFINREVTLEDKQHKKEYKGTAEDLAKIADWLVGLTPAE